MAFRACSLGDVEGSLLRRYMYLESKTACIQAVASGPSSSNLEPQSRDATPAEWHVHVSHSLNSLKGVA